MILGQTRVHSGSSVRSFIMWRNRCHAGGPLQDEASTCFTCNFLLKPEKDGPYQRVVQKNSVLLFKRCFERGNI